MITEKQKEILEQAISQYGTCAQLDMAVEECAELIQAINKLKRAGLVAYHVTKPNATMDIKSVNAYNNLCSEVADVKILLHQLELILCKERIQISVDRKIDRLEKRLLTGSKRA